jgi:hypothetical protein
MFCTNCTLSRNKDKKTQFDQDRKKKMILKAEEVRIERERCQRALAELKDREISPISTIEEAIRVAT